jgi:hypothetical protein
VFHCLHSALLHSVVWPAHTVYSIILWADSADLSRFFIPLPAQVEDDHTCVDFEVPFAMSHFRQIYTCYACSIHIVD